MSRSFVNFPDLRRCMALLLVLTLSACSAPKFFVGVTDPKHPVATTLGVHLHEIFIATSRQKSANPAEYFSGERSDAMAFAQVTASIPPTHKVGAIELPHGDIPNPQVDFALVNPILLTQERDFVSQLNRELAKRPPAQRDILVFIHGYNNSLSSALLRTAQFVQDSGFPGVTVLFSWASRDKVLDYVYDMNSALLARDDLIRLFELLETTNARQYDILAHSMGNLLLIETIRQIKVANADPLHHKMHTIVMAAPDVDVDLFINTLDKLTMKERQFYVLVSKKDKALNYSRLVAGGVDRVGDSNAKQLSELGVIAIDLTDVTDPTSLHHDTFADSPAVVQLIGHEMRSTESFGVMPTAALVDILADTKIAIFGE